MSTTWATYKDARDPVYKLDLESSGAGMLFIISGNPKGDFYFRFILTDEDFLDLIQKMKQAALQQGLDTTNL